MGARIVGVARACVILAVASASILAWGYAIVFPSCASAVLLSGLSLGCVGKPIARLISSGCGSRAGYPTSRIWYAVVVLEGALALKLAGVMMPAYSPFCCSVWRVKGCVRQPHGHGRAVAPHECMGVGM